MSINGFPDILRTSVFQQGILQIKNDLTQASLELTTGRKEDLSRALGGSVGEYNLIAKALADVESSQTRATLAGNRLGHASTTVATIRAGVESIAADAQAAVRTNGAFGLSQMQDAARGQIDSVLSLLNTSHAGRAMFAGDEVTGNAVADTDTLLTEIATAIGGATDEPTIDAAITAFFDAGGGFETSVYQGGAGQASAVELSTGGQVEFDVKADSQAFRDTLEGLVRIVYTTDGSSTAWADNVDASISTGTTSLIEMEAGIGRQMAAVDRSIDLSDAERLLLNEGAAELASVDPFEAASRVQSLEAQLNAAYTVAARLSQLTFTNFV